MTTGNILNPTQILAEINTTLPDNTVGFITPAIVRQVLADISVSYFSTTQNFLGGLTLGANGGTGGSLTLNGSITGSATIGVTPSTSILTLSPVSFTSTSGTTQQIAESLILSGSQSGGISTPINDNIYGVNLIQISSDNVSRPSVGSNKFSPFAIVHNFGGTAMIGGRNGIDVNVIQTAPTSAGNNDRNYQAGNFEVFSNQNDGGTNTGAGAAGALFSLGGAAILAGNATNWLNVTFMEANVAVANSATVSYKSIIQLAALPQDSKQGTNFDCMIGMSSQSGAVGFNDGILFGAMNGGQPLTSGGTLLRTTGSSTIAKGIDISSYSYTGNAIHTPGFAVASVGQITGSQFLTLAGATSGQTTLSVATTGGAATLSSGQTSTVSTLTVTDVVAGGTVTQVLTNTSNANNSNALFTIQTGVANSYLQFETLNNTGAPSATIQWGSALSAGLTFNNTTSGNIAIWANGLQLGGPIGGDKGVGTLNAAAGIYTNTSLNTGTNGGTGGTVVINGATSGSSTLSVNATGTVVNFNKDISIGTNGGTGGSVQLNGATSGSTTLSVAATGGTATISSGQTSTVTTLAIQDTVAGGTVSQTLQNASAANSSNAFLTVATGVSNASVTLGVLNAAGTPVSTFTWGAAVTSFTFNNGSSNIVVLENGMQVGAPTGGDKGIGTINIAGSIYQNNNAYTNPDFVLEKVFTGNVSLYVDNPRAAGYEGLMPLDELKEYVKINHRLPRITDEPAGFAMRSDIALEKIEELTLYVLDLHDEIKGLKNGSTS